MAEKPVTRVYKGWPVGEPGCPQEGMAASRDASWYSTPGTAYKMHVVAGDGGSRCCGMPLVLEMVKPISEVNPGLRCLRRGCREWWP